jgi:hypothetical protein
MNAPDRNVRISVEHADALTSNADVLVLKYAQELFGLDLLVANVLEKGGVKIISRLPQQGEHYLVNSLNRIYPRSVLFVGVEQLIHL